MRRNQIRAFEAAHPCLRCGTTPEIDWIDITEAGGAVDVIPGRSVCMTDNCLDDNGSDRVPLSRCRSCSRPPGEVHGPDCGPLMASKVERPHIITEEDCR